MKEVVFIFCLVGVAAFIFVPPVLKTMHDRKIRNGPGTATLDNGTTVTIGGPKAEAEPPEEEQLVHYLKGYLMTIDGHLFTRSSWDGKPLKHLTDVCPKCQEEE